MQLNRLSSSENNTSPTVSNSGNDNQEVKIRIWEGSPGHISLETKDVYISFWPSKTVKIDNLEEAVAGKFHTLDEDRQIEGKAAEHIYLISLPLVDMAQLLIPMKIMMMEIDVLQWRIFGNSENHKNGRHYNCASFVYRFLSHAGIETKINRPQFRQGHQLFLLAAVGVAITGGIIGSTVCLSIGIISLVTKWGHAFYSRYSTHHPLMFEQIPISPLRIKDLVEVAKAEKIERDNAISVYPAFQLKPKAIESIDLKHIQYIIKTIIVFQCLTLNFSQSTTTENKAILKLHQDIAETHKVFHENRTLDDHLENALECVKLTGGLLYFYVQLLFNPNTLAPNLNSTEIHRFPQTTEQLDQLTAFVEKSKTVNVSDYFNEIFNANFFLSLYERFPFTERVACKLKDGRAFDVTDVDGNESFFTYMSSSVKIQFVLSLSVVLQRDIIYLQAKMREKKDILLNQSFYYSHHGIFESIAKRNVSEIIPVSNLNKYT